MSKLDYASVNDTKVQNALGAASILKGILVSYGFAIIAFLILAAVVTYTKFPESFVNVVITIITILSITTAGASVAKRARTKGWLNGAVEGTIYVSILYIVGGFTTGSFTFGMQFISMLASGVVFGAFGGIIGINLKKQ